MTENEAIEILKNDSCYECSYGCCGAGNCGIESCNVAKATEEAIKALEEIQQYRAIGTVEKMQDMKNDYYEAVSDWRQYRKIGTVEEFKALKEKNNPKIPNYEGDGYYKGQIVLDTWICPNCEKEYEVDYEEYDYCPNCGQRIDHSELTEDD